jgi:hypothetical protein
MTMRGLLVKRLRSSRHSRPRDSSLIGYSRMEQAHYSIIEKL